MVHKPSRVDKEKDILIAKWTMITDLEKNPKMIWQQTKKQLVYLRHYFSEFPILDKKIKLKIILGFFLAGFVCLTFILVTIRIYFHKKLIISPLPPLPNTEVAVNRFNPETTPSPFQGMMNKVLGFKSLKYKPKKLQYEVFGYLPYWSFDKLRYLRLDLLSTISYFGLEIDPGSGGFLKQGAAWGNWNSDEMKDLIKRAGQEKTDIVVTIKLFDNGPIEQFLACGLCRQKTIEETLREIKDKGVQGVNVDFEYLGTPPQAITIRYAQFMRDLTDVVHKEIKNSTVSMAVYATSAREERIHNVELVGNFIDYVFIMGYDFFRPSSTNAGPVSPLTGVEKYGYDLQTSVSDFLGKIPAEKIVLGVPYYGYDWPVEGPGENAKVLPFNDQNGGLGLVLFDKAAEMESGGNIKIAWDQNAQVPYYSYLDQETKVWRQAYFEDERSLREKYDYIKSKKIRGVGLWALGFDGSRPELWNLLEEKFTRL